MVEVLASEAFSKVVFIQFNPIIRRICEAVQSYYACEGAKQRLPLLASLADLLTVLDNQLNWLISSGADKANISHALHLISDFLTLPLRSILFRVSTWERTRTDEDHQDSSTKAALQSAIWKCVERTCGILQRVVELSVDLQVDTDKMKSFLAAFAAAAPSHEVSEQMVSASAFLDKGEFCLESIYNAAGVIVRLAMIDTFSDEIIRLLDIAVTLLEPSTGGQSKDKSHKVQLLAISFISTCLNQIQSAHGWRKVFPATYASLYRRILQYPLKTKSKSDSCKITNLSIQCITKLLKVAIPKRCSPRNSITEKLKVMSDTTNDGGGQTDAPERFMVESRRLLPPTIIVLSDLITANFPNSLKASYITLCHVLLVDLDDLSESEEYRKKLLESVLLHLRDIDEDVKKNAKTTIEAYTQTYSSALEFIGPRIVELIESLGALAQENRGLKLEQALRLVATYAAVLQTNKSLRAATRSLFFSDTFTKVLRRNFAVLYDCEFNSRSLGRNLITVLDHQTTRDTHYRYVQRPHAQLVDEALETVGRLLGRKRAVLVMDSCFNEMYRSSLSSRKRPVLVSDQHQIEWLHSWAGCFPFMQRLQWGAFPDKHQYLGKLATAMLPVLVSSTLWSLPTYAEQHGDSPSPPVFHGNVNFTVLMLEFVAGLIQKLDQDTLQQLMPSLLHGVLEKIRDDNHKDIQDAANNILDEVVACLGFRNLSDMLVENMESSFLPHMSARLRFGEKKSVVRMNCFDSYLKSVVELSCIAFSLGALSNKGRAPSTLLNSIHRFVSSLARRFDHLNASCRDDDKTALLFVRLFEEAIRFSFNVRIRSHPTVSPEDDSTSDDEPWFRLLHPFLVFEDCHEKTVNPSSISLEEQQRTIVSLRDDTEFVDRMAWRLGYLISHSNLLVQRKAFDCLELSFRYLGWIASLCGELEVKENNGSATAILRQIHSSWSTIEIRMKSATNVVSASSGSVSTMLVQHSLGSNDVSSQTKISEQRHVLSSLFALVATICEVSGDFMASRWRPAVWPCLSSVLENCRRRYERQSVYDATSLLQESEVTLLSSAIHCISRVYCHRCTGAAFAGLIPAAGPLLLPFVVFGDPPVSKSAYDAIDNMISIDGDALYRPLSELCGGDLKRYTWDHHCDNVIPRGSANAQVVDLLARLESQREQDID